LIASGDFEVTKNALKTYTMLFGQFYDDTTQRTLIEEKIKTSWNRMPGFVRMELLMKLSEFSLKHNNPQEAVRLINEAQAIIDTGQWPPEDYIKRKSKLIVLRFRAGDKQKAKADVEILRALFNEKTEKIINIYRAGTLRPLAEAYQSMGDTKTALSIYKQAVKEGVENPNSRPRAEDLSATCCSMALYAVEPDDELFAKIHQIQKGLGQPW